MSSNISNVSFRIDTQLKNEADALFQSLGLNMTTAFNIFLRQSVREGRIPFEITTRAFNKETLDAFEEIIQSKKDPNRKVYNNSKELFDELDK